MTADPRRVPASLTVDVFVESVLVAERQAAALAVEPSGEVAGLVGAAQVAELKPSARREARLRDIAAPVASIPVAAPDEPLLDAMARTRSARPGFLLVVDAGVIVGIVAPADVARVVQARTLGAPGTPGASGVPGTAGHGGSGNR